MTHNEGRLREVGSFAATAPAHLAQSVEHPLSRDIDEATVVAVDRARARLAIRLPKIALESADRYFSVPGVHPWEGNRPDQAADLFVDLCAAPRSVAVDRKADGLQVEVRSLDEPISPEALGDPVEPGSDVVMLSTRQLTATAARNTSIELRQFDRQCPRWAPFADDLSAVTGADVFLKLFVTDGSRSVNGWHRDASDVLVTMITGSKQFAVATAEPTEGGGEPEAAVAAVLRPGDALRLPRSMLHCATPTGELSALLSMGLMRVGDWPFRQVPPTHLGFRDYPRSGAVYRLCLRSHVPSTPTVEWTLGTARLRTRIPGGIAVLELANDEVSFVAAGKVYRSSELLVRVLGRIHAADGIDLAELTDATGMTKSQGRSLVDELLAAGLVRVDSFALCP